MYLNVTEQMAKDLEQNGTAKDHVIITRERLESLEIRASNFDIILMNVRSSFPTL